MALFTAIRLATRVVTLLLYGETAYHNGGKLALAPGAVGGAEDYVERACWGAEDGEELPAG